MAARNSGQKKGSTQPAQKKKRKLTLSIAILAGVGFIIIAAWYLAPPKINIESSTPGLDGRTIESNSSAAKQRGFVKLVGRWVRTDGGYVIDISRIDADGNMEAGYYNPGPINVSRAEATWTGSAPEVFIELQDQGYPGSTYTLTYDRLKDVLAGFYYQAVMQQDFDVVFVRME